MDDARYEQLMVDVGALIESPGDRDVPVSTVFTPAMFAKLQAAMAAQGWKGLDEVAARWEADYSKRTIIDGFLKDKDIGAKRLASMPDRFTNTINTDDGAIVCRPTVINNYATPMPDGDAWFAQWLAFFFETKLLIKGKSGAAAPTLPCTMLAPIKKAKYPAITDEEEAISVPLQLLCCAIFDATLVHVLNTLAPGAWHDLKVRTRDCARAHPPSHPPPALNRRARRDLSKMSICEALVTTKSERTLKVLEGDAYADADVICLQECRARSRACCARARRSLSASPCLSPPTPTRCATRTRSCSSPRARSRASRAPCRARARARRARGRRSRPATRVPRDAGRRRRAQDGCARVVPRRHERLASTPVVAAVRASGRERRPLGLDANTYTEPDPKGAKKFVDEPAECAAGDAPLAHSWEGPPEGWRTTLNARTFLQPQLNKAVKYAERATSKLTDHNPKDFILFSAGVIEGVGACVRDNTGRKEFIEGMDIPSLTFPSDHAVVSCTVRFL